MSVNRYECGMTNAPTEYQSPAMHQDANGGYVSYDDYAALEAKCAALAAENACLMQLIDWPKQQCPTTGDVTDVEPADFIPSTSAFLAEVRAQGVEMFADDLLCPDLDSTIREFAEQLRKGVQS
ncbi:hypothetical protein [Enterobacter hormaechei]|uniref:hypothetical protein n=1 Tax=Enterobacter hormaechei TaxID=158836 RepID=UPI000E302F0B|nr:hypothetical protein [Enterobacter hormaechei]RFF35241.1 hypothetical protein DZ701_07365 [Enterobacter hormaechei]RFF35300.1 hypothetical protein DZ701_07695 [Enterobacter hormaechei]